MAKTSPRVKRQAFNLSVGDQLAAVGNNNTDPGDLTGKSRRQIFRQIGFNFFLGVQEIIGTGNMGPQNNVGP